MATSGQCKFPLPLPLSLFSPIAYTSELKIIESFCVHKGYAAHSTHHCISVNVWEWGHGGNCFTSIHTSRTIKTPSTSIWTPQIKKIKKCCICREKNGSRAQRLYPFIVIGKRENTCNAGRCSAGSMSNLLNDTARSSVAAALDGRRGAILDHGGGAGRHGGTLHHLTISNASFFYSWVTRESVDPPCIVTTTPTRETKKQLTCVNKGSDNGSKKKKVK